MEQCNLSPNNLLDTVPVITDALDTKNYLSVCVKMNREVEVFLTNSVLHDRKCTKFMTLNFGNNFLW